MSSQSNSASSNRILIGVSLLAAASLLALAVLITVLILDDEPVAEPAPSVVIKTTAPPPTTTAPEASVAPTNTQSPSSSESSLASENGPDELEEATTAWRSFSAAFLQPHLGDPFMSSGQIFAIASADDLAARTNTVIGGLVLLGWTDGQWTAVDGIPFQSVDTTVSFEVLGSRLVEHPMVIITWSGGSTPQSYALREFDGVMIDVVSGRPIEDEWTGIQLTDRSFDFLEFLSCKTGEVLAYPDGTESFFCDVVLDSRIEIIEDGSTRVVVKEIPQKRPVLRFPNDLGITGVSMTQPQCDGSYITAVGASISSSVSRNRANISRMLARYPGSSYLRNDQTCDSLWPEVDGVPVYIVYFGPFATKSEACEARDLGPKGAYVRPLDDDVAYTTRIYC